MLSRRFKPVLYACFAFAGTLLALGVSGAGATMIWNADFQTADLTQYSSKYCYQSYSCTVVPAPGGVGGYAGRFEVRSGDSGGISGERAELQINSNERSGDTAHWHLDAYLPTDFKPSGSPYGDNLVQWHHYANGGGLCNCPGSPPLTFVVWNGRFVAKIVNDNNPADGIYWTKYDLGPAPLGRWTSIDINVKWSSDASVAVTDFSINGALAAHITGHPNEYAGYYNYFKTGLYRAASLITQVVYLDNVRRTDETSSSALATTTAPSTTTTTTTTTTTGTSTPSSTSSTPSTPYTVTIASPASGASLKGFALWTAQTTGSTTSRVEFFIDGVSKWTDSSAPYAFGADSLGLDTSGLKNGSHTLMVRATSSTGQIATAGIPVTVNNNGNTTNTTNGNKGHGAP
jgi:hypothetical protein